MYTCSREGSLALVSLAECSGLSIVIPCIILKKLSFDRVVSGSFFLDVCYNKDILYLTIFLPKLYLFTYLKLMFHMLYPQYYYAVR